MAGSEAKLQRNGGDRPELTVLADGVVELLLLGIGIRAKYRRLVLGGDLRRRLATVDYAELEGERPARGAEVRAVIAEPKIGRDGAWRRHAGMDGPSRRHEIGVAIDGEGPGC